MKYEYMTFTYDRSPMNVDNHPQTITCNERSLRELNKLASAGWRVVNTVYIGTTYLFYTLEREVAPAYRDNA